MELKEYLDIFRKQAKWFWMSVIACMAVAAVWQQSQSVAYQATLLLNIGRSGVQDTAEYTYDSFYRLQADERFADTVVRWLGSPRVVEDIYSQAKLDTAVLGTRDLKRAFGAGRLSSQMIEISYAGRDEKTLKSLSQSVVTVLNRYTESLNREKRESSWFTVIGNDPVIRDARIGLAIALAVGLAIGVFIGFWAVLLRHYFVRE